MNNGGKSRQNAGGKSVTNRMSILKNMKKRLNAPPSTKVQDAKRRKIEECDEDKKSTQAKNIGLKENLIPLKEWSTRIGQLVRNNKNYQVPKNGRISDKDKNQLMEDFIKLKQFDKASAIEYLQAKETKYRDFNSNAKFDKKVINSISEDTVHVLKSHVDHCVKRDGEVKKLFVPKITFCLSKTKTADDQVQPKQQTQEKVTQSNRSCQPNLSLEDEVKKLFVPKITFCLSKTKTPDDQVQPKQQTQEKVTQSNRTCQPSLSLEDYRKRQQNNNAKPEALKEQPSENKNLENITQSNGTSWQPHRRQRLLQDERSKREEFYRRQRENREEEAKRSREVETKRRREEEEAKRREISQRQQSSTIVPQDPMIMPKNGVTAEKAAMRDQEQERRHREGGRFDVVRGVDCEDKDDILTKLLW